MDRLSLIPPPSGHGKPKQYQNSNFKCSKQGVWSFRFSAPAEKRPPIIGATCAFDAKKYKNVGWIFAVTACGEGNNKFSNFFIFVRRYHRIWSKLRRLIPGVFPETISLFHWHNKGLNAGIISISTRRAYPGTRLDNTSRDFGFSTHAQHTVEYSSDKGHQTQADNDDP